MFFFLPVHRSRSVNCCSALGLAAAIVLVSPFLSAPSQLLAEERRFSREEMEFFDVEVLPVLESNCFKCHGAREKLGGHFRITSRAGLIKGGDQGPAVHLSKPAESLLLKMISYQDEEHSMPPKGKLSAKDSSILERWVEMGAPFNPKDEIKAKAGEDGGFDPTKVSEKTKDYWAFRAIGDAPVPEVDDPAWSKNPIDAFVHHKLREAGLSPNGAASKRELIRRAYYDITGLPPTLEEIRAFEADKSDDAFKKVVDKLLDSPQYGEKWGRHWLDLVRYAESNGYERDSVKPMAWGYRDYVIQSFNKDKPYDRFLTEQLAGDELEETTADSLTATGFHRLGLWDDEPADRPLARYDYLDSILATTSEVMMGLTVGCARCHNHKIDPIPQADYYRMLAFFINISPHGKGGTNLVDVATPQDRINHEKRLAEKAAQEGRWHAEAYNLEQEFLTRAAKKDAKLVEKLLPPADLTELKYRFYRDTWDKIPNFDDLRAETEGLIATNRINFEPALRPDAMGLVFEGKLRVPETGKYSFWVKAKDGSRLRVGGQSVGEHDGTGEHKYENTVQLEKGYVPFRLDFFNKEGTPLLDIQWSKAGGKPRTLTAEASEKVDLVLDARRGTTGWRYTFKKPSRNWSSLRFSDNRWKIGPGGFGTKGTPGAIVRTEWKTSDIWMRKMFSVRGAISALTLSYHHDENITVYVNGHQVFERSGHRVDYAETELTTAISRLHEGQNLIAVHCHQTGGGQFVDVGLRAGTGVSHTISDMIAKHGDAVLGKAKRERYFQAKRDVVKSLKETPKFESRKAMSVGERGRNKTHVLLRGNPQLVSVEVQPGFPSVLDTPDPEIVADDKSSKRRLALAKWITDSRNPLTPRVAANRMWQFHFGRGLVRSPSNFGRLGEKPTHPELLDWLAKEFIARKWSMKSMHRLMMLSKTYQMSSRGQEKAFAQDPQNNLFWRFDVRRLTAEEIRDSILLASGKLNLKQFGPSIYPELPSAILHSSSTGGGKWGNSPREEQFRRSIYIFIRRSLQDPMLKGFDFADTDSSCAVRFSTTVPTQALTMLNSKFINEQAEFLADRLRGESDKFDVQIRRGFELVLGRQASDRELKQCDELLASLRDEFKLNDKQLLDRMGLIFLNLNEFFYVD